MYIYACVAVVVRLHVWDCVWIQIDDVYTGLVKFVIVWQKQEPQGNICKILYYGYLYLYIIIIYNYRFIMVMVPVQNMSMIFAVRG